jgi:signal transduction histidine kinase/ActR/RegA family two-component response regulator
MTVPLKVRGKLLGAITFASAESGRQYTAADLGLAEDLANRAAVSIENARLYAEVKEGDRRKDEFLAMLAHELRNPLAPICSGLDLLGMAECDPKTAVWAQSMMKQQVQHLVRLVDDLLDVSRIMRGKIQFRKERVQLADVVARGVETARPLIDEQKHELTVSLPQEPIWLDVDPVRIAQVITNLLNNAAKYNPNPGHIVLTAVRQGDAAVLRVLDDGIGIEKNLLPRVFDLFTQADHGVARAQGGLGIGLTLVRSLVERHGGSVEAFSEGPGKGSEFIVRLPVAAAPPEGGQRKGDGHAALAPVKVQRRVLIVDDNIDAARAFAEVAALWKHDVRIASNGAAALELAKSYHPDIVLLDIGLPGMSGYQVARQLRREPEFAKTTLVAVTGYGQEEDRRRSREAGFNHHLVKPVPPDTLYDLLNAPKAAVEAGERA